MSAPHESPADQGEAKPVRLFIALELPEQVRAALGKLQTLLKPLDRDRAIRWTASDSTHLTLKFIGETAAANVAPIQAALAQAARGHQPFTLVVSRAGCFPDARRPRVVWAGLEGDLRALTALRDAVEAKVAPLGYPTENRPFSPHLTLGRARGDSPTGGFGAALKNLPIAQIERLAEWHVTVVSLMQSDLRPAGAVYTQLAEVGLSW